MLVNFYLRFKMRSFSQKWFLIIKKNNTQQEIVYQNIYLKYILPFAKDF